MRLKVKNDGPQGDSPVQHLVEYPLPSIAIMVMASEAVQSPKMRVAPDSGFIRFKMPFHSFHNEMR